VSAEVEPKTELLPTRCGLCAGTAQKILSWAGNACTPVMTTLLTICCEVNRSNGVENVLRNCMMQRQRTCTVCTIGVTLLETFLTTVVSFIFLLALSEAMSVSSSSAFLKHIWVTDSYYILIKSYWPLKKKRCDEYSKLGFTRRSNRNVCKVYYLFRNVRAKAINPLNHILRPQVYNLF